MPEPKQTQTVQKFNAARSTWRDVTTSAKLALAPLAVFGFSALSSAGAQTAGGNWDISGAQSTVTTLIGVGVAITIALVIFKVSKRGANRV